MSDVTARVADSEGNHTCPPSNTSRYCADFNSRCICRISIRLKSSVPAVNRRTVSGRVAGPEQRIGVHDALRAITIEAAYSWRMEHELGSITPGKAATFTVLGDDPYTVAPEQLADIPILGTVYEGRWFPISHDRRT